MGIAGCDERWVRRVGGKMEKLGAEPVKRVW